MNSNDSDKPVAILDDDTSYSMFIARTVRLLAGRCVVHFGSIEAFYRHHHISSEDILACKYDGLKEAMLQYSSVVCDNNFKQPKPEVEGDGDLEGIGFLWAVGEASLSIPEKERPSLICFAPSSGNVIKQVEGAFWERYKVVCFHKLSETVCIGLVIRIAQERGVVLSRQSVVENIFGFSRDDDEFNSDKANYNRGILAGMAIDYFSGETSDTVVGDAISMEMKDVITFMSSELGPKINLADRITREIELVGSGREQDGARPPRPEQF